MLMGSGVRRCSSGFSICAPWRIDCDAFSVVYVGGKRNVKRLSRINRINNTSFTQPFTICGSLSLYFTGKFEPIIRLCLCILPQAPRKSLARSPR